MIKFIEKGHIYTSVIPDDTKWLGVTTLVGHLHEKFNAKEQAVKSSLKKSTANYPNKWYGVPEKEILEAWNAEGKRSIELGSWYHKQREDSLYNNFHGNVIKPDVRDGIKYAGDQILYEGIYPEHLVYLKSEGICGQSDYVEVTNDAKINIRDYKTSKEIKREGFKNWEGVVKKMYKPVAHLDDCHFYHYALQLSIYMYIIHRHNPNLTPGSLIIEHIKFEIEEEDKWGYPIYKKDADNNFIVKEIEEIEVPFLRKEVYAVTTWLKDNKHKLIK
jgi:hypothetical protein